MTVEQIHLIRRSFLRLEEMGHVATLIFYQRLFELAPELRPMFKNDIELQSKKLFDMLSAAMDLLLKPHQLLSVLADLGARHLEYGTKPHHYEIVGRAMLDMLDQVLGAEFTVEVREAWTVMLSTASNAMLAGAAHAEDEQK